VLVPAATAGADVMENAPNLDEAWFQNLQEPIPQVAPTDPSCATPIGCNVGGNVVRPRRPDYPENTLRVSLTAGQPDTETYLSLDLPFGAVIQSGTMIVPIQKDFGTSRPETADIQACLVTTLVTAAEGGSFEARPTSDCSVSSPATIEPDGDKFKMTIDLTPFAARWSSPDNTSGFGLALLPAQASVDGRETWQVAFASKRYSQTKPEDQRAPATSTVTFTVAAIDSAPLGDIGITTTDPAVTFVEPPASVGDFGTAPISDLSGSAFTDPSSFTDTSGSFDSTSVGSGSTGGLASSGAPAVTAPPAAAPVAAPPAAAPIISVPTAKIGGLGAAILLPLVALLLAVALGYSLTSNPLLANDREGAVSKLMRRRSGQQGETGAA
jgi:hypothetical protein